MSNMNNVTKMNALWHIVGVQLRDEMYKEDCKNISSLTMIDLSIIQCIDRNNDIIFKDICEMLSIPKSTLTSAIKRLEKKALVVRIPSLKDKRESYLELTDLGKQAQREHLLSEERVFRRFLDGLNNNDEDKYIELFAKAIENMEE